MDPKTSLEIAINRAESLQKITKMSGWKIIDNFLKDNEENCLNTLKNESINNIDDIQASRKLLKFINDFRELFTDTELSEKINREELKRLKEGKE